MLASWGVHVRAGGEGLGMDWPWSMLAITGAYFIARYSEQFSLWKYLPPGASAFRLQRRCGYVGSRKARSARRRLAHARRLARPVKPNGWRRGSYTEEQRLANRSLRVFTFVETLRDAGILIPSFAPLASSGSPSFAPLASYGSP